MLTRRLNRSFSGYRKVSGRGRSCEHAHLLCSHWIYRLCHPLAPWRNGYPVSSRRYVTSRSIVHPLGDSQWIPHRLHEVQSFCFGFMSVIVCLADPVGACLKQYRGPICSLFPIVFAFGRRQRTLWSCNVPAYSHDVQVYDPLTDTP